MDALIFTDIVDWGVGRATGPYRIASELRKNGYRVQVVDFFGLDRD